MADKWVVDADHPAGYLVPMTAAEETQLATDQAASAAATAATETQIANVATIRTSLQARMTKIRQARTALGNGNIFAAFTANEKAVIDGLLEDDIYLARLTLQLFDATT